MDLCKITYSRTIAFEGRSLLPLLKGNNKNWPDRTFVADVQRDEFLVKWKQSSVMTKQWRLVNRSELYDMQNDPAQKSNVAAHNPDIVNKLAQAYEKWWQDISVGANEYARFIVGSPYQKITVLTAHDLHVEKDYPAWNQEMVRAANEVNGFWALEAAEAGRYEIQLRRYPIEADLALTFKAAEGDPVPGGKPYLSAKALPVSKGTVFLGDNKWEKEVQGDEKHISFTPYLTTGKL
jgi:hypothetical protein